MTAADELVRARERLGLSLDEVARRTKIDDDLLDAIEKADAGRLPPPLLLRGFLRALSRDLGLDPDLVAARYLNQLSLRMPASQALSDESASDSIPRLTTGPAVRSSRPPATTVPPPLPVASSGLSIQDAGLRDDPSGSPDIVFHSGTRATPSEVAAPTHDDAGVPAPRDDRAGSPELAFPSEADAVSSPAAASRRDAHARPPSDAAVDAGSDAPRPIDGPLALGAASYPVRAESVSHAHRVSSRERRFPFAALLIVALIGSLALGAWMTTAWLSRTRADADDASARLAPNADASGENTGIPASASGSTSTPPGISAVAPPPADLTGWWTLTNHVEQSSMSAYRGLTLGFRVQLEQDGNRVRGKGYKWMENGRLLAAPSRTPVSVEGTLDGGRLALTVTERGSQRTSRGNVEMHLSDDGSLQGRFSSDAARSSGRAEAVRLPPTAQ